MKLEHVKTKEPKPGPKVRALEASDLYVWGCGRRGLKRGLLPAGPLSRESQPGRKDATVAPQRSLVGSAHIAAPALFCRPQVRDVPELGSLDSVPLRAGPREGGGGSAPPLPLGRRPPRPSRSGGGHGWTPTHKGRQRFSQAAFSLRSSTLILFFEFPTLEGSLTNAGQKRSC